MHPSLSLSRVGATKESVQLRLPSFHCGTASPYGAMAKSVVTSPALFSFPGRTHVSQNNYLTLTSVNCCIRCLRHWQASEVSSTSQMENGHYCNSHSLFYVVILWQDSSREHTLPKTPKQNSGVKTIDPLLQWSRPLTLSMSSSSAREPRCGPWSGGLRTSWQAGSCLPWLSGTSRCAAWPEACLEERLLEASVLVAPVASAWAGRLEQLQWVLRFRLPTCEVLIGSGINRCKPSKR